MTKVDSPIDGMRDTMRSIAKISVANQYIDTEILTQYSDQLNSVNKSINDDFDSFKARAIADLEETWHSVAGSRACTMMYELFSLSEARSNVIQNYVNLFNQQVVPNYVSAENTNTSLADEFK